MKIRIFALAKELKMDSKVLIDRCQQAGIVIKNSALASISQEERDKVMQFLKERGPESSSKPSVSEPLAPVREQFPEKHTTRVPKIQENAGKMPAAKVEEAEAVLASETEPEVSVEIEAKTSPTSEDAETDKGGDSSPQSKPRDLAAEQNMVPIEQGPMTPIGSNVKGGAGPLSGLRKSKSEEQASSESEEADGKESPEEGSTAEKSSPQKLAAEKSSDEKTPNIERDPMAPISRQDYIPPGGGSQGMRTVAPMAPIGNSDEGKGGGERTGRPRKTRQSRQLPNLAAPAMAPPPTAAPKKEEAPAQKPDIRLPTDVLKQSRPLEEYVKEQAEDRKRQKKSGGAQSGEGIGAGRRSGGMIESRDTRQQKRKRRPRDEEGGDRYRRPRPRRKQRSASQIPLKTSAKIEFPITIRSLSEAIGRPAKTLMKLIFEETGNLVTINASLEEETAIDLAMECGVDLEVRHERDIEQELVDKLKGDGENEMHRAPIVTILGHVDHGKTTLLDKIRSANVAEGEAGGITQHIASYQVEHEGEKITFVDTPGHAAFGEMRARGANVTDIVVLVVAADDGVMPQTKEAISHAKAAGVPMIVALNKIDIPGVDQQRVLQDLAQEEVLPAEWGGDYEVVRTSAMSGEGIDELLHTILLTAELHEYKANPDTSAHGVCLEAFRDEGRGVLTWLIVQEGTLKIGDEVLCGSAYGRIRAIYDDLGREIEEAPPSTPIKVSGLDIVPGAGDRFFVMSDVEEARQAAEARRHRGRSESLSGRGRPRTLEDILNQAKEEGVQELPLIIKADTPGSLEALHSELNKLDNQEVQVQIVHEGVGGVNESDVSLATASGAIIVAFHVVAEDRALAEATRQGVEIRRYSIIYEVTDDIKAALEGLLRPELREVPTGRVLVLKTFSISRYGTIAGCRVLSGTIDRNNRIHVIRDQRVLNNYRIASLKREKEDAKEVREGMECGIRLDGFNDVKEGDLLEAYRIEEVKRTLDSVAAATT